MLTVEEYKKSLGVEVDDLSPEEILKALKIQDELAEILFVMWKDKRLEANKKVEAECQKIVQEKTASSTVA